MVANLKSTLTQNFNSFIFIRAALDAVKLCRLLKLLWERCWFGNLVCIRKRWGRCNGRMKGQCLDNKKDEVLFGYFKNTWLRKLFVNHCHMNQSQNRGFGWTKRGYREHWTHWSQRPSLPCCPWSIQNWVKQEFCGSWNVWIMQASIKVQCSHFSYLDWAEKLRGIRWWLKHESMPWLSS